ncbi:hypothetical protein F5B18DRAFT_531422 [Nemania serpens]|nr:hypothetical protein F5B18DRAFT_531422 [Nemania serpens]
MALPRQPPITTSHNTPGAPFQEDVFTPGRPPQYNNSNQPGGQSSSSTESTNTTLTATQNEMPGATASPHSNPDPRPYIRFHVERDYGNSIPHPTQALTETALSAHDYHDTGVWGANLGGWSYPLSQYLASGVVDSNTSMRRVPPTHTAARTGTASSRTMGAHLVDPVPQTDDIANSIRAVGLQFDDVSACPTGLALLHEDFE